MLVCYCELEQGAPTLGEGGGTGGAAVIYVNIFSMFRIFDGIKTQLYGGTYPY